MKQSLGQETCKSFDYGAKGIRQFQCTCSKHLITGTYDLPKRRSFLNVKFAFLSLSKGNTVHSCKLSNTVHSSKVSRLTELRAWLEIPVSA